MKKFAIALLTILSIISVSCQIGLGAAVDTEPPKLAIENPPVDAIIRDNFALSGTWSDDGKIASITAKLTRTDGNGSEYEYTGTFTEALIKRGSGTWKIEIPVLEDAVIDGTYQAVVTIKDATDRVTTQSTTFNLDNTPPLVILQRPATDISTTDEDSIDTFGKIFSLEGRAADDNNIDHIDIKIYSDPAKTNLLDTITLRNVPLSIALDAAKWGDDAYNKIYGTTVGAKKKYWCSIEAYDAAQRYPMDGSAQKDADKNGNCTTDYYLYKEVANSSIADLKVTELYSVLNGTSSRAAIDPNSVKSVLESLKKNTGTFFLNPLNNPTFKLASWKAKTFKENGDVEDEGFIAFDGTSISFDIEPGLDSYPIDKDTLKVYFIQAEYQNQKPVVKAGAKKLYLSDEIVKITGASTYKMAITLDRTKPLYDEDGTLLSDKLEKTDYIVVIEGKDSKENKLLPEAEISRIDGYPIRIASSSGAPELNVSYKLNGVTTTGSIIYMPKTSNGAADGPASVLTLSGTVKVSTSELADKPSDFYVSIDGTKKTEIDVNDLTLTDEEGVYKFENINISFTGDSKQHSVIIVADNGSKAQENKSIMYDAEGPVVDIRSVTPIASTYKADATVDETDFINGKITVSVSFTDAFDVVDLETNKPKIEFIQGGQVKKSIEDIDSLSYTTVFDTTELTDNAEVTMKITAYDRSGNKKENPVTYKVKQVTDKPVVFPNDKDKVTLNYSYTQIKEKTGTNVFNLGTQFPIDLIDDDGLKTATFYYASVAQNSTGNEAKPSSGSEKTLSGNKNTVFYDLPAEGAGIYKIWLDVIDNVTPTTDYNKTEIGPFFIQVSSGLPVVTLKANEFVTTNTAEADVVSTASKSPLKVEIKIDSTEEPFEVKRALITDSNPDPKRSDATTVLTSVRLAEGANSVTINDNYPVSGDDGEYRLKYFVTDLNGGGNTGVNIIKFKLDKTKPTLKEEDIKLGTSQLSETDWYASDSILLDVTSTDTGSGSSGVSSVEYSLDNGANWTALTSKDGTYQRNVSFANGSNTLKIRSVDNVGNYKIVSKTVKVDVTAPDFEVDKNSSGSKGNIIYINKEQAANSLVIYGVYKDEQSGVNPLTVKLGSNQSATVKYYSGDKDINALNDSDYKVITDTSNSDKSKIKYWRAEFTKAQLDASFVDDEGKPKTTEKVTFEGANTCGKVISTASIDISVLKDLDEATLDNISLNELTKKGIYKADDTTYYVNPDLGTSYTLTGIANDPESGSGVQKVTCKIGSADPLERDTAGWSFPVDFTGAANGDTKTITLNVWDKAGNKSADYVYTVKVDKIAPKSEHEIDAKVKDLKFRIGDYDGDYDNETDVGGKYSNGTYGNASTMIIRGYYPDNEGGSGINKYYYKVFNNEEIVVDPDKDYDAVTTDKPYLEGSGDDAGKIFFESETSLKNFVISKKNDTFTTIPVESKYVAKNLPNGGKEKTLVPSNYKPTVRGFAEGKNFLVIVAEDNVGNTSIDSATVSTPTDENPNATTTYYCYSINVDNTLPTFEEFKEVLEEGQEPVANPSFSKVHLTNGTTSKEIKFYVKDADSGIETEDNSAITIKLGTNEITFAPETEEDKSHIKIETRDSDGKYLVKLTLGKDDLSNVSGYQTILATVTDKARNKSSPQTLGIINRDNIAPTVEITSPEENASVNKTITVSGKATDANEIEKVTLTAVCGSVPKEYVYEKGKTGNTLSYKDGIWTAIIDTTQLDSSFDTAGKTATLSVKAKDEAGNETADEDIATLDVNVNQHGDRPIITIGSSVDFSDDNNGEIWVKGSSTIYGSVIDDDGIADGGFKIYKKKAGSSGFEDAKANYSGGSWNVKISGDGSYVLKFEVKDKGKFVDDSGELVASGTKFNSTNFRESFDPETNYGVGDYLEYDDKLYKCKTVHPKGVWNAEHFEEKTVEDFDNTKSYSVNDIVKYDNVFYECIKVHAAGDWNKENFEACCSDAQILLTPGIRDDTGNNEGHPLGLAKNDYPGTLIPICLDTGSPTLVIEAINNYDRSKAEWNEKWVEDYNRSDFYLGGTIDKFYIKVRASDTSGLDATTPVSASFAGTMEIKSGDNAGTYGIASGENTCIVEQIGNTDEFIIEVKDFNIAGKVAGESISTTETEPFSGTLTITISATDKAGLITDKQLSKTIDNTKPTIKISAPDSVSSTAVVSGTIEGEVVNPKVYFAVTKVAKTENNEKPSDLQPAEDSNLWKQDKHASLAYNIYFDGTTSDTTTHTELFRQYLVTTGYTTSEAINNNTFTALTPVYVWIKAEDVCGNISYEYATVVVDPQGNRPNVVVSYPNANGVKLGGTIRLMGTANDNVEAKYVWIKLDINGDGKWKLADYNALKAATNSGYTFGQISTNKKLGTGEGEVNITPSDSNISDIAIMIKVTGGSWNQNINADGELIPGNEKNNTVKMWVSATDDDNGNGTVILESSPVERTFIVDKDNPYFVQDSLKLITDSGFEQAYKEGMSVKGEWWLVGTIKDDVPGIRTISITQKDANDNDVEKTYISTSGQSGTDENYQFTPVPNVVVDETTHTVNTYYNYNFKIKVGATTGTGEKSFRITAIEDKDSNALSSYKDFIVRYDNIPPTFAKHDEAGFSIETTVKNSQGYFNLSSVAYEKNAGDTGVERIAVYFTRTVNGTTYVFDPMYKRTNVASKLTTVTTGDGIKQDTAEGGDMLYWGSATVSSISGSILTLSEAAPSYVHIGGLAKIKGVIYRISSVLGNEVGLSGEPGNDTTIEFAVANVVDNTTAESKKDGAVALRTDYGYGYCDDYIYDDYDMIMENLHKDTTTQWTWELNVNSKNISDGDVDIHYVIFDKAGNCIHDVVTDASVENNKPRLVSVVVGLDKNQNGNIDSDETTSYYPEGLGEKPVRYSNAVETINITDTITVKGKMTVKPEVVGGNGDMFYRWKTTKTSSWQEVDDKFMDGNNDYDDADFDNTNDYVNQGDLTINTVGGSAATITHDTAWLIANSADNGPGFAINYEIWDSTDGKTKYSTDAATASNKVSINITGINLQVRDKAAPVVTIDDFYWNSLTDNSVYTSKTAAQVKSVADLEGHIELHGQLPSANFNATAAATNEEFDANDDKVSGKIKLKGTVSDNIVIKDLSLLIDGMTGISSSTKVATYDRVNGKWLNAAGNADFAKVGTLADNGYEFNILTDSNKFDTTGHSVDWTLVWDTEKIGNVTQNNVKVQLTAHDNASAAGHTVNNVAANYETTSTRQVDVVPYITGISTMFTTEAPEAVRSAKGYYSVYDGESITITGYNLKKGTTAPTLKLNGESATITTSDANSSISSIKATVKSTTGNGAKTATTGELSVAVNGIESLNNKNRNPDFNTGATEASSTSPALYNSLANATNNNRLTDDTKLYVWNKGFFIANTYVTDPAMKMTSNGNFYMVYDGNTGNNGAYQLKMNSNAFISSTNTKIGTDGTIMNADGSYSNFHKNAVAVDEDGTLYGVSTNTDRINNSSAKYKLYLYSEAKDTEYEQVSYQNAYTYGRNTYYTRIGYTLEQVYNDTTQKYDRERVAIPKMSARKVGNDSRVYMSYFDGNHTQNPVKFRCTQSGLEGKGNNSDTSQSGDDVTATTGSAANFHVVADKTMDGSIAAHPDWKYTGGKYTAVGATSGGVAVVAWYEVSKNRLIFSYNTAPQTPTYGGAWQTNAQVIDNGGQYVDLYVDKNNGIHIAYQSGAKLKYAYLPTYDSTINSANIVTVDGYGTAGTNITINTKEVSVTENNVTTKYIVPYISYQNATYAETPRAIRIAWMPNAIISGTNTKNSITGRTAVAGASGNFFTEGWEIIAVPTIADTRSSIVYNGLPTSGTRWGGTGKYSPVLGYMTTSGFESAYIQY